MKQTVLAGRSPIGSQKPATEITQQRNSIVYQRNLGLTAASLVLFSIGCVGSLDDSFLDDPEPSPPSNDNNDDGGVDCRDINNTLLAQTNGSGCALAGCHDENGTSVGLSLASAADVQALLNESPDDQSACAGKLYVDTAQPDNSLLYTLTEGTEACAPRMPLNAALPVSEEELSCMLTYLTSLSDSEPDEPNDDTPVGTYRIEAEDMEKIPATGGVVDATDDDDGTIYVIPNPNGDESTATANENLGRVRYTFTVETQGIYYVFARYRVGDLADGLNGAQDSWWVRMDDEAYFRWNSIHQFPLPESLDWREGRVFRWSEGPEGGEDNFDPVEYDLSAGSHTIDFLTRESGTRLDWVVISDDINYLDR